MAGINLIPKRPTENKQVAQTVKFLKTGSSIALILSAILGGVGLSVSYYFSNQLKQEVLLKNELISEINNLKNVETVMLLMKDRAQKVQTVLQERKIERKYVVFRGVAQKLAEGSQIDEINIDEAKVEFEVSADNSQTVGDLIADAISQVEEGQVLTLMEFDYNPFTGYSSSLKLE